MEKIKLKNGQELNLIPMGISESSTRRKLSFETELTYDEIVTLLTDNDNISTIQHLSEVGEILTTYADCVSLKVLSKDIETGIYTAELSIDAVERKMQELQAQINALQSQS